MSIPTAVEGLLRDLAPQVLGALVRRYGHFDASEDAVQEALLIAATRWPADGVPEEPRSWLIRVAGRRLVDELRSSQARREREAAEARRIPQAEFLAPPPETHRESEHDDSLAMLFRCCHPALSPPSQVALTLRAVGGLTTIEIARAFLIAEATMGQRISRAKKRITASGIGFRPPRDTERAARLDAVSQVLYLIFTEGHTSTSGEALHRADLSAEAIRLTRMVQAALPRNGEVAGLLALMLLTDARRAARTGPAGELIPLAEQDRTRWDASAVAEGTALISEAMARTTPGPYQLQAAIAAVHAEPVRAVDTDWPQILGLYRLLERLTGNPMVTLNLGVAAAMVHGPEAGLRLLASLDADERLRGHHRLAAVRGHLWEPAGDHEAAAYAEAARRTLSLPEQRYLLGRAVRLRDGPAG
ncbi:MULTISPECIES: RNA polymerase sigma factor [Actinoalloteichus]|uniref:RNA polymerase sigma factor, sigma-70 family n=1 Tax=Actinoalloteichus fjordicus TaxID=1612552 RepID=A0AAC9PSR5_9PSEU|nr:MULTISPECIES: sigma-70 family RNA polymerase sigma factor [Actinoalloteichus]APU15111.1 RNA polymerase sigma factor, sigma-70 family [Actinoalloteichus fjordicus]APU21179.1 RNA polymerase sigma factor, sigma-70 family [Actinoalloteichus sp. GBA129-24]